ncbi:MAG: pilus assembly FimT family protein [Luteimonas sp.]
MVAIAVLAVLVTLAAPSFADFAERSALRGAVDSVVGTIGAAKEESIKRDRLVRVDFMPMGDAFCVGAATVANSADAGCDCSSGACSVTRFPESERDMRRVTLVGEPDFGGGSGFVFDPRTGMLDQLANAGSLTMATSRGYEVRLRVNAMGRVSLCTPGDKGISGVAACG